MSEAQSNSRSRQPIIFGLSILALVLGLPALSVFLFQSFALTVERASLRFLLWRDFAWLSAVIGLVLGSAALLRLRTAKAHRIWSSLALAGVVIDALFGIGWFFGPTRWDLLRARTPCAANMSHLAKALVIYANDDDYGRFPPADKWCDLLLQSGQVTEKHFVCPKRVNYYGTLRSLRRRGLAV
jgi:hypothetical protein